MQPTTKICHEEQRKQSWCIFANAKFTQLNRWSIKDVPVNLYKLISWALNWLCSSHPSNANNIPFVTLRGRWAIIIITINRTETWTSRNLPPLRHHLCRRLSFLHLQILEACAIDMFPRRTSNIIQVFLEVQPTKLLVHTKRIRFTIFHLDY